MKLFPVRVECHSGYQADEFPVRFFWQNTRFEISEVSDRWYQVEPTPQWPVACYFRVRTEGKQEFILKHELEEDQWFIVQSDDAVFAYSLN
jgi:hypothetical protein